MSDIPAQPTKGLAHRLVGDPHSVIGVMIKRGFTGTAAVPAASLPTSSQTNTSDALNTLEQVITEVEQTAPVSQPDLTGEGVMSQVMPQVVAAQTADTLNPALSAAPAASKETVPDSVSLEQVAMDAAQGVQQVEAAPTPEISPEVESYLQKIEDHKDMAPKEIVIADGSQTTPASHQYPAQPVVILPITPEEEAAGAKKSPKFSIRWLVEWSRRLMKTFIGKVIYRPAAESAV